MWYESPIFFAVFAALFVTGKLYDSYSSLHFDWYGLQEGNKLMRDKDGLFNFKKNNFVAGAIVALSCVIGLVSHSWGAGAALLVVGGPSFFVLGFFNFQSKKKNRKKQIEILKQLRNDPTVIPDIGQSSLGGHMMITTNGRSYFEPFQFLSIQTGVGPGQDATQDDVNKVYSAIVNYARNVEPDKWFKF
jgi:hypothetical protein